ncbi:hypothetical protein [Paenirhodobacter populi]|uniref:hypothetical protein n=1 Tax=Paenirhodobacter populi TaxID=2306993 RepID=UPI0013E32B39|nr:hypothetical protein [Sinirhodobacter populi]
MNHEIRKKIARVVHAYMSGAGSESAVLQRQHEEIPLEPVLVRRMSAQILGSGLVTLIAKKERLQRVR